MKKILLPIMVALILTGCSGEDIVKETKKQDFFLETTSFSGFTQEAMLNKSGRIKSSQNIELKSTANGRVKNILVRDGDSVLEGQIIAILDDSVTNYGLSLDRAKNGLNRAEISYDSNKITLDKSVFDAEQNFKKLQNNLKALIDDSAENIKKAESDLENTNINLENSKGSLEIKKVENSILKSELDYENKIIADNETLESFYSTVQKEYNTMVISLDDIIEFSDTLYGITKGNNNQNDKIDTFLGAKNTSQKNKAKLLIKELIDFSNGEFTDINITEIKNGEDLLKALDSINTGYNKTKILLNEIEETLNNSIDSTTSLSLADIASYNATVNVYQGSLQGNNSGFIAFNNSINSYLRTYENNQISFQKSIDLMKKDLEILKKTFAVNSTLAEVSFNKTIINSDDMISSMEIQLASAENSLQNAKQIREVYLRSIKNEINEAKINYQTSINEYEKLTISSPINGIISYINIDLGQEINIGSSIFSIVNETEAEVNISFNRDELRLISEGDIVYLIDEDMTYTGSIYSLSQTADDNLKYKSVIAIEEGINLIGNIVMVDIPVTLSNILVPLDIVKIKDSGLGTMNILKEYTASGSTGTGVMELKIDQLDIKIGDIYTDKIEITSMVEGSEQIILNYVDNFDKDKFQLKVK